MYAGEGAPNTKEMQAEGRTLTLTCAMCCSFKDKEVQRDAKMVSYKVVDKETKPYIEVEISGEKKVRSRGLAQLTVCCMPAL